MTDGRDPASFRDRSGSVYAIDGRILRTVTSYGSADFEFVTSSGLIAQLIEHGWLVGSREISNSQLPDVPKAHLIEHAAVPYISYPHEWGFLALQRAALLTLDIHLEALSRGVTLADASAYNIQFLGPKPIFIDLLSLCKYQDGEYWRAQGQFVEQFLNPLLLRAALGIAHNAWFRGTMTGIPSSAIASILPLRWKLGWTVLSSVILPQWAQRRVGRLDSTYDFANLAKAQLPKTAFVAILQLLRNYIAELKAKSTVGIWSAYDKNNSYDEVGQKVRADMVVRFATQCKPKMMWDVGCNTGQFAILALQNGAERAVGFDIDADSVDIAFRAAEEKGVNLLPLVLDASNPSPSQGWRQLERRGLLERANADAVIALAFLHHLAVAQNIPLTEIVEWLVTLAPQGIIEFVPIDDPTVKRMLVLRKGVHLPEYTEEIFAACLTKCAAIIERVPVTGGKRVLYRYARLR